MMNKTLQVVKKLNGFRNHNKILSFLYCTNTFNGEDKSESRKKSLCKAAEKRREVLTKVLNSDFENQPSLAKEDIVTLVSKMPYETELESASNVEDSGLKVPQVKGTDVSLKKIKEVLKSDHFVEGSQVEEKPTYESSQTPKSYKDFVDLVGKIEEEIKLPKSKPKTYQKTFAYLFRNSAFVDLGNPVGKYVLGKIFLCVDNDLYIDFGWKFHTVCQKPKKDAEKYVPGANVVVKIIDLELSTRFLGDDKYTSLLEADCELVRIVDVTEKKLSKDKDDVSNMLAELEAESEL